MIKNILNNSGVVIGTLELPDDTSDSVWAEKLSLYAAVPQSPTLPQIVAKSLQTAQGFGESLITDFKVNNVLLGITASGKTRAVASFLTEMLAACSTGSLYMAIAICDEILANTSAEKTNLAPFVTNDIITQYKNQIQDYLILPRT